MGEGGSGPGSRNPRCNRAQPTPQQEAPDGGGTTSTRPGLFAFWALG